MGDEVVNGSLRSHLVGQYGATGHESYEDILSAEGKNHRTTELYFFCMLSYGNGPGILYIELVFNFPRHIVKCKADIFRSKRLGVTEPLDLSSLFFEFQRKFFELLKFE